MPRTFLALLALCACADALAAAEHLRDVIEGREFEREEFATRATVT